MMNKLFGAALCLTLTSAAAIRAADAPPPIKPPAPALVGTYTIVSGEQDGKPIPDGMFKGSVVRFTGNQILGTDKDKKEFFAAKYTLDTSKSPWVINMTSTQPKEAKTSGLVKADGDTVTLVYALPGGQTPTGFKTDEKQHLFVLKRLKGDGKEPQPANP